MKLEDITAEIRPRSGLEAIDLGWALGRVHFWRITQAWMLGIWPIWAIIIALLWQKPVIALLVIWAFKPFYERIPLFIHSRALFGATPTLGQTLKAWPRLFFRHWGRVFFVSHLSPYRSLTAPIADLENLSGSPYFRRAGVLSNHSGGTAWWTQVACTILVHATWIGLMGLAVFLTPSGYAPEVTREMEEALQRFDEFFMGLFMGEFEVLSPLFIWLAIGCYLAALTLIQPLYAAGGFGLYLNARSHIEGWDIELTLRRMSNRIQNITTAAALIVVGFVVFGFGSQQLLAQDATPEATISEVLDHPDFEIQTRHVPVPKERKPKDPKAKGENPAWGGGLGSGDLFAAASTSTWIIVGVVAAIALTLLIFLIVKNATGEGSDRREKAKARTVMGMNVTRESLPPDIVTAARKLWADGKFQEAVGLLYRAAISGLIEHDVEIEESDTEVECVWRTRKATLQETAMADYFKKLTEAWVRTAYGEDTPGEAEMNDLCNTWPFELRPGR